MVLASLGLMIVIDRSGSMVGEKLNMACKAAASSAGLLYSNDLIGVIAFDGSPYTVVPIRPANDVAAIKRKIDRIGGGGGTNMFPALYSAYTSLLSVDTNSRHIILLTDGQSMPGNFSGLAQKCADAGISISTIAVGPDADKKLLAEISRLSGGRMYVAESAKPLPQIFIHETIIASRSGVSERKFVPRVIKTGNTGILAGFSQEDIPELGGYVVTAAKPLANTPLVCQTDDNVDPVLAYWQAGLGRAVAFTGGLSSRWGSRWTAWSGFGKLWTQAVRYAGRVGNTANLDVETSIVAGKGSVTVSADHLPPSAQSSLQLAGRMIQPDGTVKPVLLERTSRGTFHADFPADSPGTYLFNFAYDLERDGKPQKGVLTSGAVVNHSLEYSTLKQNDSTLAAIARETGGRVLTMDYPQAVFEPWSVRPVSTRKPVWNILICLALPLFLFDVALRRLAIAPAEVFEKFVSWFDGVSGSQMGMKSAATLASLRGTKSRLGTHQDKNIKAEPESDSRRLLQEKSDFGFAVPTGQASDTRQGACDENSPPQENESDGEHTSRLLKLKRRMQDDSIDS